MTATPARTRQAPAALRLLPPRETYYAAPELSEDQRAVVSLRQGSGPVLVPGGPGTGKSTVLVESAVRRVREDGLDPERILILAPGRHAAAALRDTFTGRLDRSLSTTPARTWASYAFDVIRRAKAEGVIPLPRPPKLLSGPEQDLIIKELLEGHVRTGFQLPWPEDLTAALPTRGFRHEIRQLFDRIIESGRTAEDLVGLAYECGRPDWMAAAELYSEYRDVLDLRMPEAFDPAGIITTARQIFQDSPAFLAAERERLQLILVDDAQESNPAVFELLADISEGKDVVVTYSPDTVVQGFRGARPDLVAELPALLGGMQGGVHECPLWFTHRHRPGVADAWTRVASRISQRSGGQLARRLEQPPRADTPGQAPAGDGRVEGHVLPSAVHELRYVSQRILEAQLREQREFSDIAVIVRNGGQISQLQRYLGGQGIPVRVPVADSAVRDEVAVRPLLEVFAVVLDPSKLTPETAVSLLTSRIGGATAIELRRLRQSLRREELLGGGGRSSDVLLVEALLQPGALASLGIEGSSARRLSRMIAAGSTAAAQPGANAESVLWALWQATGLSSRWADMAMEGGNAGARADRDLDAMMALFHTAERFVDQLPGSGPEQFLDYLLNQELPMDTLAARAQLEACVEIMTPASAAGREWPVVIVAGLQEGVWPNTRLRGELLGSTVYADAVEHGVDYAVRRGPLSRLRDIRYDELRSFSTAVSRAREVLICTAVSSEDEQPSAFLDYVAPLEPGQYKRDYTPVDRPMTLRALVAELRQHAQSEDSAPGAMSAGQEAARVLARLASTEPPVPGAHPDTWWGLAPLSSLEPVVPPGGTVFVSPSKVEAVHKSPLDWFVQAAGGEAATDFARSLGTLVHSIAQELPDASGSEYVAELVRRWPTLGMKDNWEGKLDFQRAEQMVRKLAQYILIMRSEGRSLLAVEHDFEVQLPDVRVNPVTAADPESDSARHAVLRGQVDRLEVDAEGRLVIVDLKTGKRQPGKAEVARHPQLGAYQAAVLKGAFQDAGAGEEAVDAGSPNAAAAGFVPGGAVLAHLGTKTKAPAVQQQDPLDPSDNWAADLVTEAAALMAGASFEARHDPGKGGHGGHGCRLPDVCPLCARGKQVTE
ncbi:superfamily I DNA/RNA helicase [Paenarthrobacter nitroguajacolicus]|uniref:ATP-dependent helicase n=1 Tax=Paenarthrobacter nitroguajacolicus TaxID=211146 RepID=UPI00286785FB|nr:ATP-dependent DNA helicase [Paenarthrobacter nitroguajacolicus]MDR6989045.1 superfamily I DNA/RNA helicase [Paenarthrobacter nitroguajacolicus]